MLSAINGRSRQAEAMNGHLAQQASRRLCCLRAFTPAVRPTPVFQGRDWPEYQMN